MRFVRILLLVCLLWPVCSQAIVTKNQINKKQSDRLPDITRLYTVEAGYEIYSDSIPYVSKDGTIYLILTDDQQIKIKLIALNPQGKMLWQFIPGTDNQQAMATPSVTNPPLIIFKVVKVWEPLQVYALDQQGHLIWHKQSKHEKDSWYHKVWSNDKNEQHLLFSYHTDPYDTNLTAFDYMGQYEWKYSLNAIDDHLGNYVQDKKGYVYLIVENSSGWLGDRVVALDNHGKERWSYTPYKDDDRYYSIQRIAIDSKDNLILKSKAGLISLSATGNVRWKYIYDYSVNYSGVTIDPEDDSIYFSASIPKYGLAACALNPNGDLKWAFGLEAELIRSPLLSQDGIIYFIQENYPTFITAINKSTSRLEWGPSDLGSFASGGMTTGTKPNTLYRTIRNKYLLAISYVKE